MEGFLVKLGANSSVVVAIDAFCTLQFSKTADVPNSKPHPCSISGMQHKVSSM